MRTSLFLSTLCVVSMFGGVALAEKPHDANHREPRVVERLRAHGDTVDKSYRNGDQARASQQQSQQQAADRTKPQGKNPIDRSASRINCSDGGAECASSRAGSTNANGLETGASQANRAARWPAFLDKIMGNDRTNFNDADMDEGMSNRAVKRAWSSHQAASHGASSAAAMSSQKAVDRHDKQYQSSRVSCNEADECSAPTKEVKKEWSYAAIKAGTWQGPDKPQPTNAERRIKEQNAQQNGQTTQAQGADAKQKAEGGSQDHPH